MSEREWTEHDAYMEAQAGLTRVATERDRCLMALAAITAAYAAGASAGELADIAAREAGDVELWAGASQMEWDLLEAERDRFLEALNRVRDKAESADPFFDAAGYLAIVNPVLEQSDNPAPKSDKED